jgi:hypothetical protein
LVPQMCTFLQPFLIKSTSALW